MQKSSHKIQGIGQMASIESIIVNGNLDSLKQALEGVSLNELEVGYLIDLAKLNNEPQMVKLLKQHAK